MHPLNSACIFGMVVALGACNASGRAPDPSAPGTQSGAVMADHAGHSAGGASAGKHNMSAMFGPDYMKGDVGHSTGTVVSVNLQDDYITIDHGEVHGIGMGPMTMGFEALGDADLAGLAPEDRVEFLVRMGETGSYGVFMICKMNAAGEGCLKDMMPK